MLSRRMVATLLLAGCSAPETASVQLAMARTDAPSKRALPAEVPGCPPEVTCTTPTELGVKITTAYLAEDIDASGTNVGQTQAIYASPNCDTVESADGTIVDPNLGNCGIDIGMTSSSSPPQEITRGPDYVDLVAEATVEAALEAGRFAVDVGRYKYLRLDIGTNVPGAPPNGSRDTLPAGTAMNYRFRADDMTDPYELRVLMGFDVVFDPPLELTAAMTVRVELDYQIDDVIIVWPHDATVPGERCTPDSGAGSRYCLEASRIGFAPRIVVEPGT